MNGLGNCYTVQSKPLATRIHEHLWMRTISPPISWKVLKYSSMRRGHLWRLWRASKAKKDSCWSGAQELTADNSLISWLSLYRLKLNNCSSENLAMSLILVCSPNLTCSHLVQESTSILSRTGTKIWTIHVSFSTIWVQAALGSAHRPTAAHRPTSTPAAHGCDRTRNLGR